jgi:NAD(P)-dependent dehydrogenase (short-subunit alcohol dehydrogenase family)
MEENKQQKYQSPVKATLTGIADLFRKQTPVGSLKPQDRLDGKTVIVDGASSGLGFAVATEVARLGARTVMVCRSGIPEKGELVKKLSGNQDVHMLKVDFTDARSIEDLVGEIRKRFNPVDILICNAGVVPSSGRKTPQGLEEMFMVNYFSKFLYINQLVENGCLRTAGSGGYALPRIIIVSSESHRNPKEVNWEDFGKFTSYGMKQSMEHYGHNKLLLTMFSVELSRRLNNNGIPRFSVFALCPGPVNSNIARESPAVFQPLLKLVFRLFFRSPKQASQPVLYFAASPDVEGKSFDYLFLMNRKEVDAKALDIENGRKLWDLSSTLRKKV